LPIMLWVHLSLLSKKEMLVTIPDPFSSLLSSQDWVEDKGQVEQLDSFVNQIGI
jgi:hypothetical protein